MNAKLNKRKKTNSRDGSREKTEGTGKTRFTLIGMTAHHCVKSRVWRSTGSSTRFRYARVYKERYIISSMFQHHARSGAQQHAGWRVVART